eukprot:scaffold45007_cov59-Phaeocystis_antarctica.AAC.1
MHSSALSLVAACTRCATFTVLAAERQPGGFPGFPCRPLGSTSSAERDSLAASLDGGACPWATSAALGAALGAAALVPPAAPKLWSDSVSASWPLGPLEGHVNVAGGAMQQLARSGGGAEPTASVASVISALHRRDLAERHGRVCALRAGDRAGDRTEEIAGDLAGGCARLRLPAGRAVLLLAVAAAVALLRAARLTLLPQLRAERRAASARLARLPRRAGRTCLLVACRFARDEPAEHIESAEL